MHPQHQSNLIVIACSHGSGLGEALMICCNSCQISSREYANDITPRSPIQIQDSKTRRPGEMSQHFSPSVGPITNSYRLLVSTSVSSSICCSSSQIRSFEPLSVRPSPRSAQIYLPNVHICCSSPHDYLDLFISTIICSDPFSSRYDLTRSVYRMLRSLDLLRFKPHISRSAPFLAQLNIFQAFKDLLTSIFVHALAGCSTR